MIDVKENGSISLTRGDTGIINLSLVDSEGEPYVPHEDDLIEFHMAERYGADELIMTKVVPNDTMTLRIEPEDTKELAFRSYVYDIQLTDYEGKVSTVLLGSFKITKEVG